MREIKFRAWNGSMIEYDVVVGRFGAFYGAGLDPKDSASFTPYNTIYSEQAPIMQYTGLKDKKGVEIYEGDILRSPSMPDSPVEYQRGSFNGVYADGSDDEWEAPLWRYTVEVIGNIYENPELLEEV